MIEHRPRILLIGWDAADWHVITPLLDAGQMPALASLIERGCMGNIASLQPMLSPMLWTSIVTGKRADQHGIVHFLEPDADDKAVGVRPVTSTSRRCKALWNLFTQAGHPAHAVGFYASHPAEPISGVCVSNAFTMAGEEIPPDAIHPPLLRERIAKLRVKPSEISDADLQAFIPQLHQIDRTSDKRPDRLAESVARAASVQAVLLGILENEPWGFVGAYFDAIDVVSHHFMPFHPPRMDGVDARDFELYQHVVSAMYRFHDLMLARVLTLAGEDSHVVLVSDHGFHSDHRRPASIANKITRETNVIDAAAMDAQWHRPHGVLVVAGPGVRRDDRVYGATLLDVTPTILTLANLPIGRDMTASVLTTIFQRPPSIESIDTWETAAGNAGQHRPGTRASALDHARARQQLIELGYLAPGEESGGERAIASALFEADLNLAVAELSANRPARAVELLEARRPAHADDERLIAALAEAYQRIGRHQDSIALVEQLLARNPDAAANARLMLAEARAAMGQLDDALRLVRETIHESPDSNDAQRALGALNLQRKDFPAAEQAFRRAINLDDTDPAAWDGLALALLNQDRHADAADAALAAIGLIHHFASAQLHLGIALSHMGERDRAIHPLETAVRIDPKLLEAHRYLATIFRDKNDFARMTRHKNSAEQLMRTQKL